MGKEVAKEDAILRTLTFEDVEAIARIDEKITGSYSPKHWQNKMEVFMANPEACIGIELEGRLVGFMMGHIKGGEFGSNDGTAWLEIMGVDPGYQSMGIGRDLFSYFYSYVQRVGGNKIYTLTEWDNTLIIPFFNKIGFRKSQFTCLEMDIPSGR